MPRAKTYPGRVVRNKRYKNKKMHLVRTYVRYNLELGIYSDAFDTFIKMLASRIKRKLQSVVVIEGDTGSGKSTLGIAIAYALAKALNVDFDIAQDYVYGVEDLWKKLDDPKASPISLFDEGTVSLNSLNSRRSEDRDTVVLFDTMRSRGWTTIICMPSVGNLNKTVKRVHVNYVLECSSPDNVFLKGYTRGLFEVKNKRISKRHPDKDPWWNVLFTGIYGPMPPEIEAKYEPIKRDRQNQIIEMGKRRYTGEKDGAKT